MKTNKQTDKQDQKYNKINAIRVLFYNNNKRMHCKIKNHYAAGRLL